MGLDEIRLGVNIDHVATVRNARGTSYPDPLMAAKIVKEAGGDGITAHLREDRRHIVDQDISRLKKQNILPLNLEMAVTDEMQKIASCVDGMAAGGPSQRLLRLVRSLGALWVSCWPFMLKT